MDLDAFVRTHRVHTQPRRVTVEGVTSLCQFGVYTFCYRNSAGLHVQAQKNKWPTEWLEHWFYCRLAPDHGEGADLCGGLVPLGNVSVEGVRTEICCRVVDALRVVAQYQCAQDLFEEFLCAKVVPLRAA